MSSSENKAIKIIRERGGIIKTSEALEAGIHPRTLYMLRDEGVIVQVARGLYTFSDNNNISDLDLVTVSKMVPQGVVCLISALSFHEITTQIPHSISISLPRGVKGPSFKYPPITTYHYSDTTYNSGIEEYKIGNFKVKIYSLEKTIADCFKFRNSLGMDIVLEALKLYRIRKKFNYNLIMKYALKCRVDKIIRPYLEASI